MKLLYFSLAPAQKKWPNGLPIFLVVKAFHCWLLFFQWVTWDIIKVRKWILSAYLSSQSCDIFSWIIWHFHLVGMMPQPYTTSMALFLEFQARFATTIHCCCTIVYTNLEFDLRNAIMFAEGLLKNNNCPQFSSWTRLMDFYPTLISRNAFNCWMRGTFC